MESAEIQSIIHLLEEMKHKVDLCLQNKEYILASTCALSKSLRKSHQSRSSQLISDHHHHSNSKAEEIERFKNHEDLDPLESILLEKMQENSRLQMLNERLLASSRQKSQKIKDLDSEASLRSLQIENGREVEQNQNSNTISKYRDKIGRFNVEIQKLKKQISVETKKLQNEKTKFAKLGVNCRSISETNQDKAFGGRNIPVACKNVESKNCVQGRAESKASYVELDEAHKQKTLKMIKLCGEWNINDETLDVPQDLDSGEDDEVVIGKESGKVTGTTDTDIIDVI